jgi:hypothetical protein
MKMVSCLDVLPQADDPSVCTFRCLRCGAGGSRSESRKLRPGQVPGFVDECPRCRSYDVDVIAAGWTMAS